MAVVGGGMDRGRRVFGGDGVGLCARCVHSRQVITPLSLFWLCELSRTDPRFEKYPRLPMIACEGYRPVDRGERPASKS
jgi:hypothetical protein